MEEQLKAKDQLWKEAAWERINKQKLLDEIERNKQL